MKHVMKALDGKEIEQATATPEFIREFTELVQRHGYDRTFGLYLLHRHWNDKSEVLVETAIGDNQALVRSVPRNDVGPGLKAVLWQATPSGLLPMQYCGSH